MNSNYNVTPAITSSPLFLEVASPIVNISEVLRSAQTRYCKPTIKNNSAPLCRHLPPFQQLSSQPASHSNLLRDSNVKALLLSKTPNNVSFYSFHRVKNVSKIVLEEIGTFQIY